MAWWCRRYNALPYAGGIYDQAYREITLMTILQNVYDAMHRYRNAQGKDIHKLSGQERRVLGALREMGISING